MEVEINGTKKELKEPKYLEIVEVQELSQKGSARVATKKYLVFAGLTEEEAENLSFTDGVKIQKELNKLFQDFQEPTKKSE